MTVQRACEHEESICSHCGEKFSSFKVAKDSEVFQFYLKKFSEKRSEPKEVVFTNADILSDDFVGPATLPMSKEDIEGRN